MLGNLLQTQPRYYGTSLLLWIGRRPHTHVWKVHTTHQSSLSTLHHHGSIVSSSRLEKGIGKFVFKTGNEVQELLHLFQHLHFIHNSQFLTHRQCSLCVESRDGNSRRAAAAAAAGSRTQGTRCYVGSVVQCRRLSRALQGRTQCRRQRPRFLRLQGRNCFLHSRALGVLR